MKHLEISRISENWGGGRRKLTLSVYNSSDKKYAGVIAIW